MDFFFILNPRYLVDLLVPNRLKLSYSVKDSMLILNFRKCLYIRALVTKPCKLCSILAPWHDENSTLYQKSFHVRDHSLYTALTVVKQGTDVVIADRLA